MSRSAEVAKSRCYSTHVAAPRTARLPVPELPAPVVFPPGPQTRIGISGWTYTPWRGVFYPPGLPQRLELAWASRWVGSIEINGTFYGLQAPRSFQAWYAESPPDFLFSVKGSRYITHMLRLLDCRTALANFLASGVLALDDKLGPILWQFQPRMVFDLARFETFFAMLPRDTSQAAELARGHDKRMEGRAWFDVTSARPMRHAVEVRNPSFLVPEFVHLLRAYGIALVVADTAGRWPLVEDVTAPFMYVRLHGDVELYASGYGDAALDAWAARLRAWRAGEEPEEARRILREPAPPAPEGRDVYVYFDNDIKVHAPFDAARLAARLGVTPRVVRKRRPRPTRKEGPRPTWPGG
jgi:uncharacterized protein YecE (DUF72 family)